MVAAPLAASGVFGVACALNDGGQELVPVTGGDGGGDVVVTGDSGGKDQNVGDQNLPPSCGDPKACLGTVSAPWQFVALANMPTAACPPSFTTLDLARDFAPSVDACLCACTSTGGNCGPSAYSEGNDGTCTQHVDAGGGDPSACTALSHKDGNITKVQITQSALTAVTCGSMRVGDAGVASVPVRVCEPTCDAGDFCGAASTVGMACLIADGDIPCPTGRTYGRTILGTTATTTCNACGTCTQTATSCDATMSFYGTIGCTGTADNTYAADGTCQDGPGTNSWQASKLNATPPPQACGSSSSPDPGGKSAPTAPKTLCCPI